MSSTLLVECDEQQPKRMSLSAADARNVTQYDRSFHKVLSRRKRFLLWRPGSNVLVRRERKKKRTKCRMNFRSEKFNYLTLVRRVRAYQFFLTLTAHRIHRKDSCLYSTRWPELRYRVGHLLSTAGNLAHGKAKKTGTSASASHNCCTRARAYRDLRASRPSFWRNLGATIRLVRRH